MSNMDNAKLDAKKNSSLEIASKQRCVFVGRRKTAICRLYPLNDKELIHVNGTPMEVYFHEVTLFIQPIKNFLEKFKDFINVGFKCRINGGGISMQAQSILFALAKWVKQKLIVSLGIESDEFKEFHKQLRSTGFLTVDLRTVFPKRYGKKKARKSRQKSKR